MSAPEGQVRNETRRRGFRPHGRVSRYTLADLSLSAEASLTPESRGVSPVMQRTGHEGLTEAVCPRRAWLTIEAYGGSPTVERAIREHCGRMNSSDVPMHRASPHETVNEASAIVADELGPCGERHSPRLACWGLARNSSVLSFWRSTPDVWRRCFRSRRSEAADMLTSGGSGDTCGRCAASTRRWRTTPVSRPRLLRLNGCSIISTLSRLQRVTFTTICRPHFSSGFPSSLPTSSPGFRGFTHWPSS